MLTIFLYRAKVACAMYFHQNGHMEDIAKNPTVFRKSCKTVCIRPWMKQPLHPRPTLNPYTILPKSILNMHYELLHWLSNKKSSNLELNTESVKRLRGEWLGHTIFGQQCYGAL